MPILQDQIKSEANVHTKNCVSVSCLIFLSLMSRVSSSLAKWKERGFDADSSIRNSVRRDDINKDNRRQIKLKGKGNFFS